MSALHRMGVHASLEGMRLGDLGLDDEPMRDSFAVGKPVIRLWVGSSVEPTILLLAAAGTWAALNCVGGAFAAFTNGAGILRLPALLSVIMMIGNLGLSILLTMKLGVSGVLWGSVVAQVAFMLVPMTAYLIWRFRRTESSSAV